MNNKPVSDDRPFFFLTAHGRQLWEDAGHLLRGDIAAERLAIGGIPPAVGLLTGFAVAGILMSMALVLFGFIWMRSLRSGTPAQLRPWLYFAFSGFGTLLGEIGLFQLGSFLLGMPFLAVTIVLCTVLLGAGLGARICVGRVRIVAAAGVLMLLSTTAWASKLAFDLSPPGLLVGALALAATGAGFGFLTGTFFPAGLRGLPGSTAPSRRARAFAVSSAFSVAGAACGPVVAILWGTRALLGLSAVLLFCAALLLRSALMHESRVA